MKPRSALLLVVAALLAVGLAVLAWQVLRSTTVRRQSVTLLDGTVVELVGVSYGTKHVFHTGAIWERMISQLARMLPQRFQGTIQPLQITTTNESLCVWLRLQHANATQRSYPEMVITDAEGMNCGIGPSSASRSVSNMEEYMGRCFQSLPRRSESLLLHVVQYNSQVGRQRPVATFVLRNPTASKFSEWKASPLPVSARDGNLEFTLTQLVSGIDFGGEFRTDNRGQLQQVERRATNALDSCTLAAFRITDQGRVLTNWQPVKIEAWDATGNYSANSSWRNDLRDDEQRMIYQWGLWPDEPAWKLRVEFSRTSGFTPLELWTTKNFFLTNAVPGPQRTFGNTSVLPPVMETNLMGSTLQIMPLLDSGGGGGPLDAAALEVRISSQTSGLRLTLVSVTDENGQPVERSGTSWSSDHYRFNLRNLKGKKSLDVTLAYHQSRYVEFIASPQWRK